MNILKVVLIAGAVAAALPAQTFERRAVLAPGPVRGEGRCVVEITVDGTAELEIRHDDLVVRNMKGQTPQVRRFECTEPMPGNPANFRFAGVQGRGRQDLIEAPQTSGGVAAIRIDDPQGGAGNYAFELHWNGMAPVVVQTEPDRRPRRFGTDDAVMLCQSYVRDQAAQRFGSPEVIFRRTMMDDQPGRNDWVTGFFEARTREGMPRSFRFSCSVNFDAGQIRSADIQPAGDGRGMFGEEATSRAIQACEVSVEQKLTQDGFRRVDFGSVRVDDRPGRSDWVVGAAAAMERERPMWFDFSCSVDLRAGVVRSAEVTRR